MPYVTTFYLICGAVVVVTDTIPKAHVGMLNLSNVHVAVPTFRVDGHKSKCRSTMSVGVVGIGVRWRQSAGCRTAHYVW